LNAKALPLAHLIKRLKVLQNHAVLVKLTYNKKLLEKQIITSLPKSKKA